MSTLLRYKELHRVQDHHDIGITAAAFSPRGSFLATAGLDGKVCVWEVSDYKLSYVYKGDTAILSLCWSVDKPGEENSLVIGYQDGNVGTLSLSPEALTLKGFPAHSSAVERMAMDGPLIATATQQEVRVWEWHPCVPWKLRIALSAPSKTSETIALEVLVVSVHWTLFAHYPAVLVVAYQNHGVFLYEPISWTVVHTVNFRDPVASTAVSTDGTTLAAYNLLKGIELRNIADGTLMCTFPPDAGERYLIPVMFIHGGHAVVGGTTSGVVGIWDLRSSQKIQDLNHQPHDRVLALAAYYDHCADRFLIATGTYGRRGQPTLRWWVAEEEQANRRALGPAIDGFIGVASRNEFVWLQYVLFVGVVVCALLAFYPVLSPMYHTL
ncbi:WD40-repeat-containing domain protein [Earliella scabrosa]|nr:WD40-repeat-containing domain protein [Earliella scabrosa]